MAKIECLIQRRSGSLQNSSGLASSVFSCSDSRPRPHNFELKIIQPAVTIVVDVTCLRFGLNKSYFHPTTAKKTPRPHNLSMELRFKWSIIVKFVLYINVVVFNLFTNY